MTTFVVAGYGVVVLGAGAVLGVDGRPSPVLAVLATALVAVGLEPVRVWLRGRLLVSPYDLLTRFAAEVSGGVPTDDVCPRMARVLGEATGAHTVEVRLFIGGEDELAARWPGTAGPIDETAPGMHAREVRHGEELLGRLVLQEAPGRPLNSVELRLLTDLGAQAGLALRTVLLSAELRRRVAQASSRATELRISRERIVSASDNARMRLERNIHDGAQQHLVALTVRLSLAHTVAGRDPARAATLVRDLRPAAVAALATLEELSAGIYPRRLADAGLAVALRAAVTTSPIPVKILDGTARRHGAEVEAAIYFSCLEAVQNAIKHAQPSHIRVELSETGGQLGFLVRDEGRGFVAGAATAGSGWANIRDRVASLGGVLTVDSTPGTGTTVSGVLPVGPDTTTQGSG